MQPGLQAVQQRGNSALTTTGSSNAMAVTKALLVDTLDMVRMPVLSASLCAPHTGKKALPVVHSPLAARVPVRIRGPPPPLLTS